MSKGFLQLILQITLRHNKFKFQSKIYSFEKLSINQSVFNLVKSQLIIP